MGRPVLELLGKVFGELTVVERNKEGHRGRATWNCVCTCGNTKVTTSENLVGGKTKSCGCLREKWLVSRPIKQDLTGFRFGMLVVQHIIPKAGPNGPNKWHCKCDCGNTFDAAHGSLTSKHTESCGCQQNQNLDITNKRFGRLVALERLESKNRKGVWKCQCDCGALVEVKTAYLQNGGTKSCGCLHAEKVRTNKLTHGATSENSKLFAEYQIWMGMKQRCDNPKHPSYKYYGGRGITVSDEWRDFDVFIKDMGAKPTSTSTLERVDNSKGYEPGNVKWETRKVQGNNSRKNHLVEYQGKQYTVMQLWEQQGKPLGLAYTTLVGRLRRGVTGDDVVAPHMRQKANHAA